VAQEDQTASKTELRLWNVVIAACMALGGWWLQNQYDTMLRLAEQLQEYRIFVDTQYVEKEFLDHINGNLERRLDRIETKIDALKPEDLKPTPGR
jgi:hypothetical protein